MNRGTAQETLCFHGAALESCRVASGAQKRQRFEFALPAAAQDGGWLAKLVGCDEQGRRAVAYFNVPAAPRRGDRIRLTGAPERTTR